MTCDVGSTTQRSMCASLFGEWRGGCRCTVAFSLLLALTLQSGHRRRGRARQTRPAAKPQTFSPRAWQRTTNPALTAGPIQPPRLVQGGPPPLISGPGESTCSHRLCCCLCMDFFGSSLLLTILSLANASWCCCEHMLLRFLQACGLGFLW